MSDKTEYLTKEKFDELSKELEELKTVRRKEVAENLEYAKSLGDLSENAEYHEAREMQANVEDRIAKLDAMLKSATIVSSEQSGGGKIGVGSDVVVRKLKDKKASSYKIVGSEEANVKAGKLSIRSPLGEAMIGRKKGDVFKVVAPGGIHEYEVVEVG